MYDPAYSQIGTIARRRADHVGAACTGKVGSKHMDRTFAIGSRRTAHPCSQSWTRTLPHKKCAVRYAAGSLLLNESFSKSEPVACAHMSMRSALPTCESVIDPTLSHGLCKQAHARIGACALRLGHLADSE